MPVCKLPVLILSDFDGTLTRYDTFPLFLYFAMGKGIFLRLPVMAWHVLLMKIGVLSAQKAKERILALSLHGWEQKKIQQTGKAFIMWLMKNEPAMFRAGALDMIRRHKEEGGRIVIVSASPEEWVGQFAEAMGVECLATKLEYGDYGFTGKIAGENCAGQEKVRRIRELIPDMSAYSIKAYGDSPDDYPMLDMASQVFYKPFRKQE